MPKKSPKKQAPKQETSETKPPKRQPPKRNPRRGLADELETLLEEEAERAQLVPLREGSNLTYRDEANVILHQVMRAGYIEDLHAGKWSPILTDPAYSRITEDEMKRLMIETSAGLAHWLFTRDIDLLEDPQHYLDKLQMLRDIYLQSWERHARTCAVPALEREPLPVCVSCRHALHADWRFCPMCGAAAPEEP